MTMTLFPRAVLPGTFEFGATIDIIMKDVDLAIEQGEALGVPMWVHEQVGQLWRFGEHEGLGRADLTALIQVLEGWAGVEVRSRRPVA